MLEEQIIAVPEGRALWLDLNDIALMDTSFADAAIVTLQQRLIAGCYANRFFVLANANPTIIENLEGALARRRIKAPLLTVRPDPIRLIGHLERNLHEAWTLVAQERVARARELADLLGIEIGAAGMRLLKLSAARVLARCEEVTPAGRQHVYAVPV